MSFQWTQVLVSLRNADPTALTALACLRRSLGFGERLLALRRRVLWELSGPAEADRGMVIERLRLGGELWNPNKEQARIRSAGEPIDLLQLAPAQERSWFHALAWSPERDLDRRPHALRSAIDGERWSLRRGILWSLKIDRQEGTEGRKGAEEAVLCSAPGRGLLVHPQLEDYRWIDGDPSLPWVGEGAAEGLEL